MQLEQVKAQIRSAEMEAQEALEFKKHKWKLEEIRLTKQLETAGAVIVNEEKEEATVSQMLIGEMIKPAETDSTEKAPAGVQKKPKAAAK